MLDVISPSSYALREFNDCLCPALHTVIVFYSVLEDRSVIEAMCGPNHPMLKEVALKSEFVV